MYKDILDPHQICLSKIVGLFCILILYVISVPLKWDELNN